MDEQKKDIKQLAHDFERQWDALQLPDMPVEDSLDLMDYYTRSGLEFEAELCRRMAERKDPQHPEVMLTRAHWFADDGDWNNAEQTRKSVPETSRYENLLFTIERYVRSMKISAACQTIYGNLPALLELPDYDFLFDCAALLRDYGYVREAGDCLRRIPSTYVDYRQTQEMRAECEVLSCDYPAAKETLNRLLDAFPFNQNLWAQLATCCFRAGENAEATDACEYSLAIGNDQDALRIKALIAQRESGHVALRQAIANQDYVACLETADIAYENRDFVSAHDCYTMAGLFCPRGHRDREHIVFRTACCLIHSGLYQEAFRELTALYALGAGNWGFYYECAQLYLSQKSDTYAVQTLQFCIRNGLLSVGHYEPTILLLTHYNCYEPARKVWTHIMQHADVIEKSFLPFIYKAGTELDIEA